MVRNIFLTALFIVLVIPVLACAHAGKENLVEVRIVSDSGEEFAKYRTYPRFRQEGKFFYMEAPIRSRMPRPSRWRRRGATIR